LDVLPNGVSAEIVGHEHKGEEFLFFGWFKGAKNVSNPSRQPTWDAVPQKDETNELYNNLGAALIWANKAAKTIEAAKNGISGKKLVLNQSKAWDAITALHRYEASAEELISKLQHALNF
jgi:hypothetical protein